MIQAESIPAVLNNHVPQAGQPDQHPAQELALFFSGIIDRPHSLLSCMAFDLAT